jgi:glucoamylase
MAQLHHHPQAFGQPGLEPRWQQGNKDGVGTADSLSNQVWFTLSRGILNEVYINSLNPQIGEALGSVKGINAN